MSRLTIIVIEQFFIIALLIVLIALQGCTTIHGLHTQNITRNATAKWQQYQEHQTGIVK